MLSKDAVLRTDLENSAITTEVGAPATGAFLQMTLAHLAQWHTGDFTVGPETVVDCISGRSTRIDRTNPLETVARILPQDFCILTPVDSTWRLSAATVCFTSRWDLPSKMGCTLSEIHDPVPGYESRLSTAVDHVIARLSREQVLKRSNWTLLDTDVLHLPEPVGHAAVPSDMASLRWLRIEHQSLRRLPGQDAIIFTIDTRVHNVAALAAQELSTLRATVDSASPAVARYKSWPHRSEETALR